MARVLGFSTREGGRDLPVFTFVEAHAASAFDIFIHNSAHSPSEIRYLSSEELAYEGWTSADLLLYGGANGGDGLQGNFENGLLNKPIRELVGVQPTSIKIKSDDLTLVTITGNTLAEYIERTEFRYLTDGHLAVKVYLLEKLFDQVQPGDIVILEGCLLLQGGRSDLGVAVNKRQVPFVLAGVPASTGDKAHQNPTVDVARFLTGADSSNIGATVKVQDLGTANDGIQWNSVRTKTKWLNGTPGSASRLAPAQPKHQRSAFDLPPEAITAPGQIHFLRNAVYGRNSKPDFRKLDLTRDRMDMVDPQSQQRIDRRTSTYRSQRKGDQFSLLEFHGPQLNIGETHGYINYGLYAWKYVVGPSYGDTKYGASSIGGSYLPQTVGGDFLPTGLGIPNQGYELGDTYGYDDSATRSNARCENLRVHPDRGIYRSPYYPHAQSEFMHYVTFYKWENTNFTINSTTNYNITNGVGSAINSNDVNIWAWYASWAFQSSYNEASGNPDASNQTALGGSQYMRLEALNAVLIGNIGWQDFISNAFYMGADPDNTSAHSFQNYISTSENQELVPAYDKLFSGVYHATRIHQTFYNASRTIGANIGGGEAGFTPASTGLTSGWPTVASAAVNSQNLSSSVLFTYTAFVYAESPQAIAISNDDYAPWATSDIPTFTDVYGFSPITEQGAGDTLHRVKYRVNVTSGGGSSTLPPTYAIAANGINGVNSTFCTDKNSEATWAVLGDENETSLVRFRNLSLCNEELDYDRCGCRNVVESLPVGEVGKGTSPDSKRFETVVIYPRNVVTDQYSETGTGGADAFPSLLYVNSYFSVTGNANVDNGYALNYLADGTLAAATSVEYRTTNNSTQTVLLSEFGLGFNGYGDIFQTEFLGLSLPDPTDVLADTNTFTYKYFPGRDPYIDQDLQFFVHDSADEARVFATIGGAGYNSAASSDDEPHRHMLLFSAGSLAIAGTDPKRAHVDLGWTQSWENTEVECSILSLGITTECSDVSKDKPPYRNRKFVVIGDHTIDTGFEDNDGDGDPDNSIKGCTDENAVNFNPNANVDDGSCYFCETALDSDANALHFVQALPLLINTTPGNVDSVSANGLYGTAPATYIGNVGGGLADVPTSSPDIYDWQDGNLFNAVNTSENALTSGSGGGPNTAFTYFAMRHDALLDRLVPASDQGSQQQLGNDSYSGGYQVALNDMITSELASRWVCQIYTYDDWQNRTVPANTFGNGWAVESNGDGSTFAQTNVYYDIFGNFSGVGLESFDEVATLANQYTGDASSFYFRNFDPDDASTVTDIGLEAGREYVAVLRFQPLQTCGQKQFYYMAYHFFVEYCECTDPTSTSAGNYAGADNAPWQGTPWDGVSFYPGVNTPTDQFNTFLADGSGVFTPNFCVTSEDGISTGLLNSRICEFQGEDESVTCGNFYSWCLTEIATDCVGPDENGNVYGEANFSILIDGFFVQSDPGQGGTLGDAYQLIEPQTGFAFYYIVEITVDGILEQTVVSHIVENGLYVPNPEIAITQSVISTFQGANAVINAGPFDFDQDNNGSVGEAVIGVTLQATGLIDNSGQFVSLLDVVDYIVDDDGNPTSVICPAELISYVSTSEDCVDLVEGCMDETAVNFNPDANSDDGSCEYIPCEEIFNDALNSIFITDVESTRASSDCVYVAEPSDGGEPYYYYDPNYDGSMTVTVQDYSVSSPTGALGANEGNFVLFVAYVSGGNINVVGEAMVFYDNNVTAIQGLGEGEFLTMSNTAAAFIGVGDMTTTPITNGDPFGIGESLAGSEYEINVPLGALFGPTNDLTGGQYLLFVVPHIDATAVGENFGGLEDCIAEFGQFADEQTYHVIDMITNTDDCPQPCNQFTNPDDCPDNVAGCTDPGAENYDPDATIDDGTCVYCTTCDFCDLYPTHPECLLCDKRADETLTAGSRGFSASLRDCEGGGKCCADQSATNYDPECRGENADNGQCTYACNGAGCTDCEDDPTGEGCVEDPCPDPNNPDCVNPPIVNCLETGDCPCVGNDCNPECLLNPELCNPGQQPCEQSVANNECEPIETFTTTTIVCNPIFEEAALNEEYDKDWLTQVLMSCASGDALKYMFRLKAGIHLDDVDTTKLALIAYLFIEGSKNNLDCLFDCDNYEAGVKRNGKVRGFSNRMKEIDCKARWAAGRYQRFAASSNYRKGTTVKYTRVVNGVSTSSYYTAKSDWSPGMTLPGVTADKKQRVWEACINVKFQSGGNPENYFQTFVDFIKRYCDNCEIDPLANSGIYESNEGQGIGPNNRTQDFGGNSSIGFQDEDGNEIIF